MNAKMIRAVIASVVLASAGTVALAAGPVSSSNTSPQAREYEHGSMMGGGMMGMGGMMGGCPMMGGTAGMDPKTAMRMHGEMMRAMGDIMLKYSEQSGTAPSK
ncbi:putative lipid-binding transport protein (Tim44 family) [Paraburkholderia sp. JPY158]|uniref:Putative lipid-binding transport protein (Tim44 family) n=1 Tax=Paraburkholderia atlantica TaxID=2654982 RepID=A0A7W8QDK1_PARAM|nr:hypothetical protein [Paraburkholderia atlantica]MBB5428311.1 putative lipid-binding transport protein (Tim44 family) [Paraburkholderia atlantica]